MNMKDKYNIKVNPPELNSEQISKHQDFDSLFAKFQESTKSLPEEKGNKNTPLYAISSPKLPSWMLKYGIGSIVAIAASVLIIFMLEHMIDSVDGGIPTTQIEEQLALLAPIADVQKSYSHMIVNLAEKGETLEYHSGSKIIVPPSAFVDEQGITVVGKVEIQYREFNDHVDMFLAGVPKELDKHQNLQSVGMMEIKGFQNGKPVYLGMDKTLDVELKGKIIADFPTSDLDVFVYSKQKDNWIYSADDQVEIIAELAEDKNIINHSLSDAEILAKVETSMSISKPDKPINVGIPENMQVFNFQINKADFPALAQYDEDIEFIVDKTKVDDAVFEIEWNSMDIKEKAKNVFELALSRVENEEKIIAKYEIYPAISATEVAKKAYIKEYEEYKTKLQQWQNDVDATVAQMKLDLENIVQPKWTGIINRFTIHRFGLWNCGKTVEMESEHLINARFVNQIGDAIAINQLFITNKNNQLYYSIPNSENSADASIKYDDEAKNILWALTEENELLVANTKDTDREEEKFTFRLHSAGIINSEEDVRKLLTF